MKKVIFFCISIIVLINSNAKAQSSKVFIDSTADLFLDHSLSTCIVIGVIDHGKQHIYCYGNLSKTGNNSANDSSIFEIGSITKLFTATATAIDIHKGKLKYDDNLSTFLTGVFAPNFHGKEIKIIDLLHHTSGLPAIPDDLFTSGRNPDSLNPYKSYTRGLLDSFISGHKLDREPGTKYQYSNLGFGLMGDILSRINSESYENVIKNEIWIPLNMNHTSITLSVAQKKMMASPFNIKGKPDHLWDFDALAGAGAIRSDLVDMLKFLNASMYPEELKDTILRNSILDCENKDFDAGKNLKVGLAWHISPMDNLPIFWQNGGTGGYRSFLGFNRDNSMGIVVLTNSATSVDKVAIRILDYMFRTRQK